MKRNLIIAVALGAGLLCSTLALLHLAAKPVTGKCKALSELPLFGATLPRKELGEIKYVAKANRNSLYAKVSTTQEEFERLAHELNLSIVQYSKGFNLADDAAIDNQFRPASENASLAYGRLTGAGRHTIRLYFEPDIHNAKNGIVYLHVS